MKQTMQNGQYKSNLFTSPEIVTSNKGACTQKTWMNILVFQLHYSLHCPVVVIEVDGSDHFGAFQVSYLRCHFADGVAADQLHHLLSGSIPCVHFNGGKLNILRREKPI